MSDSAIYHAAWELLGNPKITKQLELLRKPARDAAGITLLDHLLTLEGLREEARAAGQFAA